MRESAPEFGADELDMDESPAARQQLLEQLIADYEEEVLCELRLIPRGGPKTERLGTLPAMRKCIRADDLLSTSKAGSKVYDWLVTGLNTLPPLEVEGNLVDSATAKLCLEYILKFKSPWLKLKERRARVLTILGSRFPRDSMRRWYGPEWELLRGLAKHLVAQSRVDQITS